MIDVSWAKGLFLGKVESDHLGLRNVCQKGLTLLGGFCCRVCVT